VLIEIRKLVENLGVVAKNLRVTAVAIEFDLYVPDSVSKERALDTLTKQIGKLLNERDLSEESGTSSQQPTMFQDKEETIRIGVALFNEERFWECHETIEQIWRRETNKEEKDVQQGFILAASLLVHHQRDEDPVALGMIPRTLVKLNSWNDPTYYSLKVDDLKRNLIKIKESGHVEPFSL
jgi:hypothetical protein